MIKSVKRNLLLLFILLVEIGFLFIGLHRALKNPVSIEINNIDLFELGESKSLTIGDPFEIHSGAVYELEVFYSVETIGETSEVETIEIEADDGPYSNLKKDILTLNPARKYAYGRVYAEGSGEGNIVIKLHNNSRISISSIIVTEVQQWQWLKCLIMLVAFIVLDVGIICREAILTKMNWELIAVVGVIILASAPLLIDYQFGGHDLWYHSIRIDLVAKELAAGHLPVRLYSRAYNGYGYAGPIFYGDIMLYIPALLYNMMFPMEACVRVLVFIINTITVLTSYFLGKEISNDYKLGILFSVLYTYSPYRLTSIFVRGAVGEYSALAFLPLIALGMYLIYRDKKFILRNSLILAVGVSCTTMCHVLSVELAMVPMVILVIMMWRTSLKRGVIQSILFSVLIYIGITAWFIIPFVHTMINPGVQAFNSESEAPIQGTGAYLIQLINPFFYHKGGTATYTMSGDMSMSLGIGAVGGVMLALYLIFDSIIGRKREVSKIIKVILCIGCINSWMATIYFPWNYISRVGGNIINKIVNECQFLCRYLGTATLILTMLLIFALVEMKRLQKYESFKKAIEMISLICIVSSGLFFLNYFYELNPSDLCGISDSSADYIYTYFSINSNTPGTGAETADIQLNNGKIYVDNSSEETVIYSLPLYAFNNVGVIDTASGRKLDTSKSENGLLIVTIPACYKGTLAISYKEPLLWRLSEVISVLSILVIAIWVYKKKSDINRVALSDIS